jgi:two-component system response regulator BaeR
MEAATNHGNLNIGALEIRSAEFMALLDGRRLELTVRYRVVWGEPYRTSDRSVDVYVGKLRQKLEQARPGRQLIHTHFGFGYRLSSD